ncbi:MAG: GWxTD domain-containing protein [Candidatus Aminicenantes bacterium]|nr:GWxTD domain-containing protein [Candidatus Aminicenantes bacterium]
MKKICLFFFFLALFLSIPLETTASKKKSKDLNEKYRKWLEEEVVYIISPKEKDVFLQLNSDKERDIFIEAFWKQRDPTPGTPENEFKEEHYLRVGYANTFFGRESTRPGWKTDRGRIYIILGKPIDIDRYESSDEHYPVITWFYQGDVKYGLPPHFNVAFFKKRGIGEYTLYSPVRDGPQNLLRNYHGDSTNYDAAYEELKKIDVLLAQTSLTLIPGERPYLGHPSIASETMMANIFQIPRKQVDDLYAEKLLRYKDVVEVEYTANYVGSDYLVTLIKDTPDIFFVHFSVDPRTLSVGSYEETYYSYFELVTQLADLEGKTVYQYQKTYSLDFDNEQLKDIRLKSYSIQDMFPLVPGQYKLNVLLKNTVSKEFTSFEADIFIPEATSLVMTPLLLAYKVEPLMSPRKFYKPFAADRYQLFCQPNRAFTLKDDLVSFFQVHGLRPDLVEKGTIQYTLFKEKEEILRETVKIQESEDRTNFIKIFPLRNFSPGYYSLKVALIDAEGREILQEKNEFSLSALQGIARPWVISRALPATHSMGYSLILGNQHLNKGQFKEARVLLESVYRRNPSNLQYAYGFSRVLFLLKEYEEVKNVLQPFLSSTQENHEFLRLLGQSSQALKEYEAAIQHYKNYLSHTGTNLLILNSIGECYSLLGKIEEAIATYERSLEIDPNQQVIKEKIRLLRKK